MKRTTTGDSSICLRSRRPSVSVGVARSTIRARTVARASATVDRPRRGGSTMPPAASVFVGIDVAKPELVMAIRPSGERWTATNDDTGIQRLVTRLREDAPALVVLEATGGYERAPSPSPRQPLRRPGLTRRVKNEGVASPVVHPRGDVRGSRTP